MKNTRLRVLSAACALLLAGALLLPGTAAAGLKRIPMSEFSESLTYPGAEISVTPGEVIATPGVSPDPAFAWGGTAAVKLRAARRITEVSFYTGGYLVGRTTRADFYRVRFGQKPEHLAAATYAVPDPAVPVERVALTWDPGADQVVRARTTYYITLQVLEGTNVNGALVRFQ